MTTEFAIVDNEITQLVEIDDGSSIDIVDIPAFDLISEGMQGPPGPAIGKFVRFEVSVPSLVWKCEHQMGTKRFLATLWDADGNQFSASIKTIDDNAFEVRLTSAKSGAVDALFDAQGSPPLSVVGS